MPPGRGDSLAAALLSQPTPPPEPTDPCPLDDAADDLDFDPFEETEKGLSALLEREREQQARQAAAQRQQALRLGGGGGVLPPAPGLTSFNAAAAAPRPPASAGLQRPQRTGSRPAGPPAAAAAHAR